MSRLSSSLHFGSHCFPRVSGDEPIPLVEPGVRELFSPRERG